MSAETTALSLSRLESQLLSAAPSEAQYANYALRTSNALASFGLSEAFSSIKSLTAGRSPKCPPCPTYDFAGLEARIRRAAGDICFRIPGLATTPTGGSLWTRTISAISRI